MAQQPNIYIISEHRHHANKSLTFVVSYRSIEIYSKEMSHEGEYSSYLVNSKIKTVARTRIKPAEYRIISEAIDSSFGHYEDSSLAALGGFHWSINEVGTRIDVRSVNYQNSQTKYYVAIFESIKESLGFFDRRRLMSVYRKD